MTEWINDESVTSFHRDLEVLRTGGLEQAARQADATSGHEHIHIVGFGLAPEFDQFVKPGLIYGERVVHWDTFTAASWQMTTTFEAKRLSVKKGQETLAGFTNTRSYMFKK
ncbi:hypothetical protein [Pseudomonas viridiflava]|uniref:hypothetical protein n=1 Tax=Pseudomonas viridiflava TaxID=33069 RepID=UPI000F03C25F|nr:hypothetical protein [Pseudomonas viridiflava]